VWSTGLSDRKPGYSVGINSGGGQVSLIVVILVILLILALVGVIGRSRRA